MEHKAESTRFYQQILQFPNTVIKDTYFFFNRILQDLKFMTGKKKFKVRN